MIEKAKPDQYDTLTAAAIVILNHIKDTAQDAIVHHACAVILNQIYDDQREAKNELRGL